MENKFAGMTVNERLHVSGLLTKFDKAVKEKNVIKLRTILIKINLDEININDLVNNLIK